MTGEVKSRNIGTHTQHTMITSQNTTSVSTSGIKSAVSFGIKDTGLAHIFNVLRNQLYTDKIGAVVREYSANAYDANVEAGNGHKPIVVSLPSSLNKVFKIRDNGRGLSSDDIREIYCFYGESTKRQSNAFIGQLGLGSKSAFAYGDNFVINSFTDGIVRSYNAFIDPSGIGQIALLSEKATDEANGVEIVIPVKQEDIPYFHRSVKQYLRFFKVRPTIVGMAQKEQDELFAKPIGHGDGWGFYYNISVPHAVMGNIAYPIARESMKLDLSNADDKRINILLNTAIAVDFQIGELDVAASREGLQYTPHTLNNLKKTLLIVADRIVEEMQKKIGSESNSIYSAKRTLNEMDSLVSGFFHVRQLFFNHLTFKGKKLTDGYLPVTNRSTDKTLKFRVMRYKQNYNGNINVAETNDIPCNHDSVVILNDLGAYNVGASKARHYCSANGKVVFMFTPQIVKVVGAEEKYGTIKREDRSYDQQIAEIIEKNGFVKEDFILASSIVIPSNAVGSTNSKAARTGVLLYTNENSWRNRNCWKDAQTDLKNGSGVYVRVNNYNVVINENNESPSRIKDLVSIFDKMIDGKSIVGVTKSQMSKLGGGWVSLQELALQKFHEFIKTNNLNLCEAIAYEKASARLRDVGSLAFLTNTGYQSKIVNQIKDQKVKSLIVRVFDAVRGDNNKNTNLNKAMSMIGILERFGVDRKHLDLDPVVSTKIADDLVAEFKAFSKSKPMLNLVDSSCWRWQMTDGTMNTLTDYINA